MVNVGMHTVVLNNIAEDEVPKLGADLAGYFSEKEVIYLNGELDAGKTSLIRHVLASLGYVGRVKSPSYSIAETYDFNGLKVAHLDLYRVDNLDELIYLSLDEYAEECNYIFIEWAPENCGLVPPATITIQILMSGGTRNYTIRHNKNINLSNIL